MRIFITWRSYFISQNQRWIPKTKKLGRGSPLNKTFMAKADQPNCFLWKMDRLPCKTEGWAWCLAFVRQGSKTPKSRSLRITQWNCLGEQTNKEKKVTNGGRAVKNFHLKWVTVIHVRSHETQQRCNCIQSCLCSFETWNRTFSKRSKKLKIAYQKSPCRVEICVTLLCSLQGQTE